MFQISLAEHVRLSFGSALAAYEGHAEAAARLSRRSSYARIALLAVSGLAAVVNGITISSGYGWHVTSAILTVAVFASCATYVGMNQPLLIYGHRVSASKLWVVCEKYRGRSSPRCRRASSICRRCRIAGARCSPSMPRCSNWRRRTIAIPTRSRDMRCRDRGETATRTR